MAVKNILLIGNGFDLAHSYKTSYSDFLKSRKSQLESIDIELFNQSISELVKRVSFDNSRYIKKDLNDPTNEFYSKLASLQELNNWCDIEKIYFDELLKMISTIHSINRDVNVKKIAVVRLNFEFESVKNELKDYLNLETGTNKSFEAMNNLLKGFEKFQNSIVVNFNYTHIVRDYYDVFFRDHIYIHGEIELNSKREIIEDKNPIIFGYSADEEKAAELLNHNVDEYLKNIKQYEYLGADNYSKILRILDENDQLNVFLLGLSCGESDKLILKNILGHSNVQNIFNFYYDNKANYLSTFQNINRIIGQKDGFKKYRPLPFCLKMPQYNDDFSIVRQNIDAFFKKNYRDLCGTYTMPITAG